MAQAVGPLRQGRGAAELPVIERPTTLVRLLVNVDAALPPIRTLARVSCYAELHRALRHRVNEIGISRSTLDEVAGLTSGYASKLLAPWPLKRLGELTAPLIFEALGVELETDLPAADAIRAVKRGGAPMALVEDRDLAERMRPRWVPRSSSGRWPTADGCAPRMGAPKPKPRKKRYKGIAAFSWMDDCL